MSKQLSIKINCVIPSINIFPLDLIYTMSDSIREYDYLVLAEIDSSPQIIVVEELRESNLVDNEVLKWFRNIRLWPVQFTWILPPDNCLLESPLHVKLCKEHNDEEQDLIRVFRNAYSLGAELFNILYYTTLFHTPSVMNLIVESILKSFDTSTNLESRYKDLIKEYKISDKELKFYTELFRKLATLLRDYRLGLYTSVLEDRKEDHGNRGLCSELIDESNVPKNDIIRRIREFFGDYIRGKDVLLIFMPQIMYPVPSVLLRQRRQRYYTATYSYRLEKHFLPLVKSIVEEFCRYNPNKIKVAYVFIGWGASLRGDYDYIRKAYENVVREIQCPNIEVLPPIERSIEDLDRLVCSNEFKSHYIFLFILQDYRKDIVNSVIRYLERKCCTKQSSQTQDQNNVEKCYLMLLPEYAYIPSAQHGSRVLGLQSVFRQGLEAPIYRMLIYDLCCTGCSNK